MDHIEENSVVTIHFTLTNDDGEVLDSSEGETPMLYLHGAGQFVPGLERELAGLQVGDSREITVTPEDGYGHFREGLMLELPRDGFPEEDEFVAGMPIMLEFEGDEESEEGYQVFWIQEVTDDSIFVDGNHPLAGQTLHFSIEVVAIREATQEEIEHGHAHGEGGHVH